MVTISPPRLQMMDDSSLSKVVAGLLAAGLLLASAAGALAGQEAENPYSEPADVRIGERLFLRFCGRCHGDDAKGGIGPDLTTGRFRHGGGDGALFRVISEGVSGTEMIPVLRNRPNQAIWQVITYLRSLSTPADLELPGSAGAGEQLFRGKGNCGNCHMVAGEGGRLGPELSEIGNARSPEELKTDLLDPDARVQPRWWTLRVVRQDGSQVEGFRIGDDTFSVRIMDDDESLWSFQKKDLQSVEVIESSTMPSYAETLSETEVYDLVAYLYTRRK